MGLKMLAAKKKEKKRLNWNLSEDTSDILTWFYVQPTILIEQRGRENGWALNDTINLFYYHITRRQTVNLSFFVFVMFFFLFRETEIPAVLFLKTLNPLI